MQAIDPIDKGILDMASSAIKHKRRPSKRAMLSRSGSVTDWGGYIFVYGDRHAGDSSRRTLMSLDIRGEFTTPVRGIAAFTLRIAPEAEPSLGNAEIACVGVWTSIKPTFDGSVDLSDREFDLVRTMASSGKLVSVHFSFQEPHYGKSLIASASFSSEPPADD